MYAHMSTCNMHITGTIGGQDGPLEALETAGGADTILENFLEGMCRCVQLPRVHWRRDLNTERSQKGV